ncbi:MAG: ClpXP protease specificity-enhancing factor [Pseudomonadota bacterium]
MRGPTQQPYFLRALYEWCVDSSLTPYITVRVDNHTRVPQGYVKNGQIVLNVGPSAVRSLHMDNEWVTFSARFGGQSQDIVIPVGNVLAIYAKETGEGMSFEGLLPMQEEELDEASGDQDAPEPAENRTDPPQPPRGKPQLRVVK